MLLPASQCQIIDTWTVGGLRGTGSHDVAVRDVFVPIAFASGFFDTYVLPEPRYRIPAFSRVIPGLGAMALGIARTAIETLKEIAGAKTPVHTHPGSEAFYVLTGKLGHKTPHGVGYAEAGATMNGHGADMPMEVFSAGASDLDQLVMFVVDANRPFSSPAKFD